MTDEEVVKILGTNSRSYGLKLKIITGELLEYLQNRYSDSQSLRETMYRIIHHVDVRPTCQQCGGEVRFRNATTRYNRYCSKCGLSVGAKKLTHEEQVLKNKRSAQTRLIHNNGIYFTTEALEKCKQTSMKRYGVDNAARSPIVKQKIKDTCIKTYGAISYLSSDACKNRRLELWGVDNYRKTEKCKQYVSYFHKTHKDELNAKRETTFLERYGVDNAAKIPGVYDNVNWDEQKRKERETKTKNGTLGGPHSKAEDTAYNLLITKFPNIVRHYYSDSYPFECDFFIPELNLYIEYKGHQSHGNHPYNENDVNDKNYVDFLINTFGSATTFTIRDPHKREVAKQNNLNYIEFWSIKEVEDWLKSEAYKVYIN